MSFIVNILAFFWLVRTIKHVFFWLYLWQLKEYHVGRFMDHFRTHKGKLLIFNPLLIIKFVLLVLLLENYYFLFLVFYVLLFIYIAESASFLKNIISKNVKLPKLTKKTVILTWVSCALVILYLFRSYNYIESDFGITISLLVFDLLTPIIISLVVLAFQPIFVVARNNILKKASEKRKKFNNLLVIAITGSYGKTSTKEFLTTILSQKFNVLSTKEHQNSEIGIARCILNDLHEGHEIFVVEMGSYNKDKITLLCDIVQPKIGLVTGVNEQHLALFGSLDNLLSAEGGRELLKSLPANGMLVVNGDNAHCLDLYKTAQINKKIYTAGQDQIHSDIWTQDITVAQDSISFIVQTKDKQMHQFLVNVLGKHNVQNLLGAIIVAKELGMSLEQITLASKNIRAEQAGMVLKMGVHGINLIDSSYSSNPDGVIADLDYLSIFQGKKVIVMPCLIELGEKSETIHRNIGKKIAQVCDMAIITTKDKLEDIKIGAKENGMDERNVIFSENPVGILSSITTFCKEGDAVLLEGRVPEGLIKLLNNK